MESGYFVLLSFVSSIAVYKMTELSICMVQVFPLLMQQLSFQEQSSLVWQFICSVPVMLMEQFLPWMMSFLSPGEQADVIHSVQKIIPVEKSFQEVDCQHNSHGDLDHLLDYDCFKYVCEGGVFLAWLL